jgi:hypothetical protein
MELYSSCYIVSLVLCLSQVCFLCIFLSRGGYLSIYTGQEVVLEAIFGAKHALHHLYMSRRHRHSKERQGGAQRGAVTP